MGTHGSDRKQGGGGKRFALPLRLRSSVTETVSFCTHVVQHGVPLCVFLWRSRFRFVFLFLFVVLLYFFALFCFSLGGRQEGHYLPCTWHPNAVAFGWEERGSAGRTTRVEQITRVKSSNLPWCPPTHQVDKGKKKKTQTKIVFVLSAALDRSNRESKERVRHREKKGTGGSGVGGGGDGKRAASLRCNTNEARVVRGVGCRSGVVVPNHAGANAASAP